MSARARFSQADIERAIRAFEKHGLSVGAVEFMPDGTIRLEAAKPDAPIDDWRSKLGLSRAA